MPIAPTQKQAVPVNKPMVQTNATPKHEIQITGRLKVLNGSNAGKELVLTKPVTTMGTPGRMVIAFSRQGPHYVLTSVEGDSLPKINDQELSTKFCQIHHGDVIDLMGVRMQFHFQ